MRKQNHFAGCADFSLRLHCRAKGIPARLGPRSERKKAKGGRRDHTHREELEEALQPLERVDSHSQLSSSLRPCLEPQLEAGRGSRRVVHRQPRDLPPTRGRLLVGDALRPWGAAVDRQAAAGLSYGAQCRLGCVLRRCAPCDLQAALFWPMMFFGGTSYLLKLWFLDRMTLYYEQHREREEPPKKEAEAAMTPSSA